MRPVTCDLGLGAVTIDDNTVTCGGVSAALSNHVTIVGTGDNAVSVRRSTVVVALEGITASVAGSAFSASGSTVLLQFSGTNLMTGAWYADALVECSGLSTLTVAGYSDGLLEVNGTTSVNAIGTPDSGSCQSILLLNGGYLLVSGSGPAIGTRRAMRSGDRTTLGSLGILGGTITAIGCYDEDGYYGGGGIGSDEAAYDDATSSVGDLIIVDGNINAIGSRCAGIGSSWAAYDHATSSVANLTILGGNITAIGVSGPGIGSGDATYADTKSTVGNLNIFGGNISATGQDDPSGWYRGGGIGSYSANYARATSSVDRLTILGGNIQVITGAVLVLARMVEASMVEAPLCETSSLPVGGSTSVESRRRSILAHVLRHS
jgi:hypothetical protein